MPNPPRWHLSRRAATAGIAAGLVAAAAVVAGLTMNRADASTSQQGVPVPDAQVPMIAGAALACPTLSAARLAAQVMAATGFQNGPRGIAGLSDDEWNRWKPWPDARRADPAAGITALSHLTCELAGQLRSASLGGDLWESAVAARRSGVAAVLGAHGVPGNDADFVSTVREYATWYATRLDGADPSPPVSSDDIAPNLAESGSPALGVTQPAAGGQAASGQAASGQAAGGSTENVAGPAPVPVPAGQAGPGTTTHATTKAPTTPATKAATTTATKTPTTAATTKKAATTYEIQALGDKCVDVPGAADGVQLRIWGCAGDSTQAWTFASDGTLRNAGLCMDLASASSANGTRVQLATCNGGWAQKFAVNGSHDLVNTTVGKCVDIVDDVDANGTKLQLWDCTGAANQKWTRYTL